MIDLKKQFAGIKDEILGVVTEILESAHYILGPKVAEFERRVSAYHGVPEAIGVASGTDALHLALKALGIGDGDEVITTPFTFFATAEAVIYTGAKPVFVDIDPDTMNIDPAQVEAKITKRTKAIIPVHIFGHPADMDAVMTIARKHDLRVIEDCAQSFGADIRGKKTGSFGDAGCFSFYPSKNLGAFGDGGLVTLHDTGLGEKIRMLRNHGSKGAYRHESIGFNSRLDELQAGILLVKFSRIDMYNGKRRENAALYNRYISGSVLRPVEKPGMTHVYHQYTIRSPKRDAIKNKLNDAGISSVVYYPNPLHLQEALSFLGHKRGDFPVSEEAAGSVLSLPMYPELEEKTIREIAEIINNV
ncbi:MAG TPA: DegT/DnrJ/EryC1/StrS family aminotransferase [Thermodesulfovibrionales bacterium]|nr:DegT/DnrJ/EryC1/StrS family aminotransferase [Thermodesulfovibrionales bacterium]